MELNKQMDLFLYIREFEKEQREWIIKEINNHNADIDEFKTS